MEPLHQVFRQTIQVALLLVFENSDRLPKNKTIWTIRTGIIQTPIYAFSVRAIFDQSIFTGIDDRSICFEQKSLLTLTEKLADKTEPVQRNVFAIRKIKKRPFFRVSNCRIYSSVHPGRTPRHWHTQNCISTKESLTHPHDLRF